MAKLTHYIVLLCLTASLFAAAGPIYRAYKFHQSDGSPFHMETLPGEGAEQAIQ